MAQRADRRGTRLLDETPPPSSPTDCCWPGSRPPRATRTRAADWRSSVDTEHGYAYAGTSNPYSKKIEHENTNAIPKIDIDPRRRTFGEVVGSYKGLIEQYDPAVREAVDPLCDAVGEDPNLQLIVGDSAPCLQLDLTSVRRRTCSRDSTGRLLVGDLQKAGVYHAVDAGSMQPAWKTVVGAPCAACNAAAWAFHRGSLVDASSPGGTMVSLAGDEGTVQWASPVADGTHYQSASLAGGVAIASGMVIVATGNDVVAYAPTGLT